jgi:hypothetical protein
VGRRRTHEQGAEAAHASRDSSVRVSRDGWARASRGANWSLCARDSSSLLSTHTTFFPTQFFPALLSFSLNFSLCSLFAQHPWRLNHGEATLHGPRRCHIHQTRGTPDAQVCCSPRCLSIAKATPQRRLKNFVENDRELWKL